MSNHELSGEEDYRTAEFYETAPAQALEARKRLFVRGHQDRYGQDAYNLKASLEQEQQGEIQPSRTPTPPEGDRSN